MRNDTELIERVPIDGQEFLEIFTLRPGEEIADTFIGENRCSKLPEAEHGHWRLRNHLSNPNEPARWELVVRGAGVEYEPS